MTRPFEPGEHVWNADDGRAATVLATLSFGVKVSVEIDPDEWSRSAIGPPSEITEVWETWKITRFDPAYWDYGDEDSF